MQRNNKKECMSEIMPFILGMERNEQPTVIPKKVLNIKIEEKYNLNLLFQEKESTVSTSADVGSFLKAAKL